MYWQSLFLWNQTPFGWKENLDMTVFSKPTLFSIKYNRRFNRLVQIFRWIIKWSEFVKFSLPNTAYKVVLFCKIVQFHNINVSEKRGKHCNTTATFWTQNTKILQCTLIVYLLRKVQIPELDWWWYVPLQSNQ